MIEFTIGAPLLLLAITIIVDGGLLLVRYSQMTYAMSEMTRSLSVGLGNWISAQPNPAALNCAALNAPATGLWGNFWVERPELVGTFRVNDPAYYDLRLGGSGDANFPFPVVVSSFAWEASCLMCRLIPWTIQLTATSRLVIENNQTTCASEPPP